MSDKRMVPLPEELCHTIEAHLEALGARSVEAFLEHLVRERLSREGLLSALSPDEQAEVEDQLKRLGYME